MLLVISSIYSEEKPSLHLITVILLSYKIIFNKSNLFWKAGLQRLGDHRNFGTKIEFLTKYIFCRAHRDELNLDS